MKLLNKPSYMELLWRNIEMNIDDTMARYCELLHIPANVTELYMSPDTWRKIMSDLDEQSGMSAEVEELLYGDMGDFPG